VYQRVGSANFVEELVAQAASFPRARNETRNVDKLDWNESDAINAKRIPRVIFYAEFFVDARRSNVADSPVWFYRCERVVGDVNQCKSCGAEER
jgi:hypothetical protein